AETTTETLTATVTPPAATGAVQFNDNSSPLGDPVPLTSGTATTTTALPAGDHSLTADYIRSTPGKFNGSTSDALDHPLTTPSATGATSTTITLEVAPASPPAGTTTETLTATVTPSTAVGVVQFTDGGSPLGDPVTLANGIATTTTILLAGDHSLTAD